MNVSQRKRKWSGLDGSDDAWKVEVETDCFDGRRGFIVSLYIENARPTENMECGLAELTTQDARELAAALLHEAEAVDRHNAARESYTSPTQAPSEEAATQGDSQ